MVLSHITLPLGAAADLPVLLIPEAIFELVKLKSIDEVLLLVRWHKFYRKNCLGQKETPYKGPLPGWPPTDAALWQHVGIDENPDDHPQSTFDVGGLNLIRSIMRRSVPTIGRATWDIEVSEELVKENMLALRFSVF